MAVPLFDGGSKSQAANYRLVSLACVAGKLVEQLVSIKSHEHSQIYQLLSPQRHSFWRGRSCLLNPLARER